MQQSKLKRVLLFILGASILGVTYLGQHTDVLFIFSGERFTEYWHFAANRTARIILNDTAMLCVIYAIFVNTRILKLAVFIQAIDLFILFPIYLALKLSIEGSGEISHPLLSQLHRLIVHPTLLLLLIPALLLQQTKTAKKQ